MINHINHIFELLCLSVALVLWIKHKSLFYLSFSVYLFLISSNELIAHYLMSGKNHGIYQLNTLAFVVFNGYIFNKISLERRVKILAKIISVGYLIFWLIWLSYFGLTPSSLQITLSVALHLVNIICLFYLYTYMYSIFINNLEIEKANFWYVGGVVVFCSGMSICFSLLNYFSKHCINFLGIPIHNTLPKLFCVILYTCTIIALLLWRPKVVK